MENSQPGMIDSLLIRPAMRVARMVMGPRAIDKMIKAVEAVTFMAGFSATPIATAGSLYLIGKANEAAITAHPFVAVALGVVASAAAVAAPIVFPREHTLLEEFGDRVRGFRRRLEHAVYS